MKYTILLCTFFTFFVFTASAQNGYSIKGTLADSVEHVNLGTASVTVLQAKDSVLVKFGYAKADGSFMLDGLRKGNYILLVSYPDYADYAEHFSLDSANTSHVFGILSMTLKSRLLKEVIIKGTASQMKIKGDTTEFNAKAFVIQPNAKVEDLLKQLPGITVDKDGKITAQGETVNKVLVDGEEFFGDDPTLVTRNIRADMVDKIQLYDKKSDQAAFTGVDDGKTQKTINVKLRADKNKGMFGKVVAGESPNNIYQGELLFNAFKAKEKFSVYGTIGNNGKVGLGWQDEQKYGAGNQLDVTDNGININTQSNDDLDVFGGNYSGQGLPVAQSGGIHYDGKFNNDKESLNANYKIANLTIDGLKNVLTQSNYPGAISNSVSNQNYHNSMFRQKLSGVYTMKLDTSSDLKISLDATWKHIVTNSDFMSADTLNDVLINNQTRQLNNTTDQRAFNGSAFYTKKFRKPGRTLSFLVTDSYSQSTSDGFLKSHLNFYNTVPPVDSLIDQIKTNDLQSNLFNTNLTYSEPLSKTLTLVVNYGIGTNHAAADRKTFNQSAPTVLLDTLSSNYTFDQFLNHAGAILNYKKGKVNFNFGTRVTDDQFHQVNQFNGNVSDRTFIDWAPQARFQYRFSPQKQFTLSYNGTTTQPTLDQLQPVASNSDPLNIVVGNPTLTPSFTNTFNINYRSYKVLTDQFFGFYGQYSFVNNPIVNHINYSTTTGRSISQYFNLGDKSTSNFYGGMDFGRKFKSLGGLNAGIGFNVNGNTYYNYSNDSLNKSKNIVFNPNIRTGMFKQKKIELGLQVGPTYTISETSLQPNVNNNGWGARGDINGTIYLPWKFQIGTYSNYQYNAATASFHQTYSQFLLNVFLSRTFLKNNNLMIELWGNDLLNQNAGFTRTAQANLITQTTFNTIKRYFMLTINYDFTKMAVGASK
ncbi:MAG TPA: outer membrane beta-barrel protein [Mucilaginibacter sp.]